MADRRRTIDHVDDVRFWSAVASLGPELAPARLAMVLSSLAVLAAQRTALLDARDDGTFDADLLERALASLDASQIALEMRSSIAV